MAAAFHYLAHTPGFPLTPLPLGASPVAQTVKNLPAVWEARVQSLVWKDPLEKEMANRSSILAWKIPWTEEPDGSPWGRKRVGHNFMTKQSQNL